MVKKSSWSVPAQKFLVEAKILATFTKRNKVSCLLGNFIMILVEGCIAGEWF